MKRLLSGLLLAGVAHAGFLRMEVREQSDVLDGKAFGSAGAYERVLGKAFYTLDPKLAANKAVVDLDKAPRNKNGLVEFSADVFILRPKDSKKGNGTVLYEVSNRGSKSMLTNFNRAANTLDPRAADQFGDGLLMNQGYTLLWVGWQFDMPQNDQLVYLHPPVAAGLKGIVRAEFTPDKVEPNYSVADRNHQPYKVLNPEDPALKLTVRDRVEGPRTTIARGDWRIEDGYLIVPKKPFEPGRIYELVYTAENPPVAGTGFVAVRDMISSLRYDEKNPLQHAYGFGVSQSGRFLRTMMYYGFNRDEKGRKIFDGLLVDVAGGGRGGFNMRFAQASRDSNPFQNTLTPVDIFPFTDLEETDPETGMKDGLLTHALPKEFWPKIFYMNSEYEYYGRAASLIHITLDGKADAPIAGNTRIYMFAGGQHGPAQFPPPKRGTQNLSNPNPYTWTFRALLAAMDGWVKDGKEPPPSQYPHVDKGQLVALNDVKFPKIPGVAFPTIMHLAYPENFGPQFRTKGITTQEPPEIGKAYPLMVPQVDQDGNDIAGIHMPEVAVPLATYTGWNLRSPEAGAPDQLATQIGSFIPFARTKAERAQSGDPRLSMEERYTNKEDYLRKFEGAAKDLATQRYLLPQDVPALVQRGAAEWDWLHP